MFFFWLVPPPTARNKKKKQNQLWPKSSVSCGRRHPKISIIGFQTVLFDEVPQISEGNIEAGEEQDNSLCAGSTRLAQANDRLPLLMEAQSSACRYEAFFPQYDII